LRFEDALLTLISLNKHET